MARKSTAELHQLFRDGKITVNDVRSALGFQPLPSGGDVFRSKSWADVPAPPAPTSVQKGGVPHLGWPNDF